MSLSKPSLKYINTSLKKRISLLIDSNCFFGKNDNVQKEIRFRTIAKRKMNIRSRLPLHRAIAEKLFDIKVDLFNAIQRKILYIFSE